MSGHAETIRTVLDWPITRFNAAEHADALASLDALLAESQRLREALRLVSIWADDEGARMPVALVAFVRGALAGGAE